MQNKQARDLSQSINPIFEDFARFWIVHRIDKKTARLTKAHSVFTKQIVGIRRMRISDITRQDVWRELERILEEHSYSAACNAQELINKAFECAIELGVVNENPTQNIEIPRLANDFPAAYEIQIEDIQKALKTLAMERGKINLSTRAAVRLSIVLLQPVQQVCSMEWCDIDLNHEEKNGLWAVPPAQSGSGRPHFVPLSQSVYTTLNNLKKGNPSSRYVFLSATDKEGHLSCEAVEKMLYKLGLGFNPSKAIREVAMRVFLSLNGAEVIMLAQQERVYDSDSILVAENARRSLLDWWSAAANGWRKGESLPAICKASR